MEPKDSFNTNSKSFVEKLIVVMKDLDYSIYRWGDSIKNPHLKLSDSIFICKDSEASSRNRKNYVVLTKMENQEEELKKVSFWHHSDKPFQFGASDSFKEVIYNRIYNILSIEEKEWFIKTIISKSTTESYSPQFNNLPREDKWIHIANIYGDKDIKIDIHTYLKWFDRIKELSPKSEFEINCFSSFIANNKNILTKKEILNGVWRYIRDNIDPTYIDKLPKSIRALSAKEENKPSAFEETHSIELIKLSKQSFYDLLNINDLKYCNVKKYNELLSIITYTFRQENVKSCLNINSVDLVEFSSSNDVARIFFESNSNGFKHELKEIFSEICRKISSNNQLLPQELSDFVVKTTDYLVMNKDVQKEQKLNKTKQIKL